MGPAPGTVVRDLCSLRRLLVAAAGAIGTALVVGVPTVVIPNPLFGRELPVTWWSYPVLAVVSVLSGVLLATYVREREAEPDAAGDDRAPRRGLVAGMLSFFAVGCPVCNKIVLLALGTSGAVTWFAPVQPWLAAVSIGGLVWAVRTRLAGLRSCPVPADAPAPAQGPSG
ncbi:MAG: hypothetical protein L0H79_18180 [Intrasporangium sp.]|uniref:hypothetical protein n=1 Tax=Intrasporangium sp. TaxID=1925024 RepID=UPI0026481774|nr:hypothetical protein [Intrasporangium sp.]MDN5797655.1 hypothetical protein [Intrasporangium sp.]